MRDIEHFMSKLDRSRAMARSTIQEKLTGKTPIKLHQALSLVAAIAEYARENGTPLTPQETDENSWRAEFVAASGKRITNLSDGEKQTAPSTSTRQTWDATPLRTAGMTDLIELISQSEMAPLTTWLPHVAGEMRRAQMSCGSLMEWAAKTTPNEIVQCIVALDKMYPLPIENPNDPWGSWSPENSATAGKLLMHTAREHGRRNAPVVVVGLRRAGMGKYVSGFLDDLARWHLAPGIREAVKRLEAAELGNDATQLLKRVGSERQETRVMEVVNHFHEHKEVKERNAVLSGMASEETRFMIGIKEITDEGMVDTILSAIPWPKRAEYVALLKSEGREALASQIHVPVYGDEPPF